MSIQAEPEGLEAHLHPICKKASEKVETQFSQLADQFFVIRDYAKGNSGLFARNIDKVSTLTALRYANINNKPIRKIKYALI